MVNLWRNRQKKIFKLRHEDEVKIEIVANVKTQKLNSLQFL